MKNAMVASIFPTVQRLGAQFVTRMDVPDMPQSERSQIMIAILRWLEACAKSKSSPRILQAKRYIERELCGMGATPRTVQKYLLRLEAHGLIRMHAGKLICTQTGKNWLEKKVS